MSIHLDDDLPGSIYGSSAGEIADSVRNLVAEGSLRPADPVPPIRDLAPRLGVHRNTVAAAYRLLVAAGVAETRGRHGTFIRRVPALPEEGSVDLTGQTDLASGNPDPHLLPDLGAALQRTSYVQPLYGVPTLNPQLEEWAKVHFSTDVPSNFSLTVTNGAVDAVERLLTAHLTRGDAVAVEEPCFLANANIIRVNGFRAVPVAVDTEGPITQDLRNALEAGARAFVCTPRAHNPTGASTTSTRAEELRFILSKFPHVLVVEDDHFSAIATSSYETVRPPSARRWALVRSMSKFLGPDLRVALVASDSDTAAQLGARLRPGATWVSHLLQRLTVDLLTDPSTERILSCASATYQKRSQMLIKSLGDRGISIPGYSDGLNIWVPLEESSDSVVARLAAQGWVVRDGIQFSALPSGEQQALRVTTSTMNSDRANRFSTALSHILR